MENTVNQIEAYKPFEASLAEFKVRYENMVYNMSVPTENMQARSDQRSIGTLVSRLKEVHDEIKAPVLAQTKLIDGEHARIRDSFREVQGGIKDQIKAYEDKIQARKDEINAWFITVEDDSNVTLLDNVTLIQSRLDGLESLHLNEEDLGDRHAEFEVVLAEAIVRVKATLEQARKQKEKDEELEELRAQEEIRKAVERDNQLKQQAADQAVEDERKRVEDEDKKKAKAAAAQLKKETEDKMKASNIKRVESEAAQDIAEVFSLDIVEAREALNHILDGAIRHVQVHY